MEKKLRIGIIGSGRAAIALLAHFQAHDIFLSGVYGRNSHKTTSLSSAFGIPKYNNPYALIENSDVIILAVRDDSIRLVAEELLNGWPRESTLNEKKLFVHVSGALSSDELHPLLDENHLILSAHMIQTLPAVDITPDLVRSGNLRFLEKVWFTLEGSEDGIQIFSEILKLCGNEYFRIDPAQKPLYHAALCVLSNYMVTLMGSGFHLLQAAGLNEDLLRDATVPLIQSTINNVIQSGPGKALTGPIARGDFRTIQNHLDALTYYCDEESSLYSEMGLETLSRSGPMDENKVLIKGILTESLAHIEKRSI